MFFLMMVDTEEDKRKFVILYEKYRYLMMAAAYDVLGDKHLAEDAVHEAFIKVAKNMEKIQEVDSQETKSFLVVVTRNSSIDIYRKRKSRMGREIFLDELPEKDIPSICMESDMDNGILDILKNLPDKYRDVFMLKYSSRLENKDIAELLGLTEGNVRQRIARGKVMIQDAVNKLEGRKGGSNR